jgi:hypothetical protein
MAANARLGLSLRARFGRGGTEVGVRRAHQLAERQDLSPADIKSIYSYFARHAVDMNTSRSVWGSTDHPSPGFVAWLLWGGDAGREWVAKQRAKLN